MAEQMGQRSARHSADATHPLSPEERTREAPRREGRPPTRPAPAATASGRQFWLWLGALLLAGLLVRLAILASPLGELDGDEAVVGLMARHIAFLGDRPVFYYNQQYLGSLEAFTAAPLFKLLGSSTLLLKLVPTTYSLGFVWLTALVARRLFGNGPALVAAAYLALPPAMGAVWSTKARGGYAELLFLGAALLLVTLWLAERRRPAWGTLLWGLLAGLAFWTHLLAIVYLVPGAIYLLARRRRQWSAAKLALGTVGVIAGMWPMLAYNVAAGFPTIAALLTPPDLPLDPAAQLFRFFRVGIPVLIGLGQPTTSADMFDRDWLNRPAGNPAIALVAVLALATVVAWHARTLRPLFAPPAGARTEPALLVLLAVAVPLVVAVTRFGFFVSEPRYALPLYAVVPLVAQAIWHLPRSVSALRAGRAPVRGQRPGAPSGPEGGKPWPTAVAVAALLALNLYSLLSTDVRLWRPEEAVDSTAATRAELARHLEAEGRHQLYTDYWIAYPLMFESQETVFAYVISGGFNRYIPPADNVQRTANAVWVFVPGSEAEGDFLNRLRDLGGTAQVEDVSVYRIYKEVTPIDRLRPAP